MSQERYINPSAAPNPPSVLPAMAQAQANSPHAADPYARPEPHQRADKPTHAAFPQAESAPTKSAASGSANPRLNPTRAGAQTPPPPSVFNGATIHGMGGLSDLRHPLEIPLVVVSGAITALGYSAWIVVVLWLLSTSAAIENGTASSATAQLHAFFMDGSVGTQALLFLPLLPIIIWVVRALTYAQMRAGGVQMSPTQFPEGYRMVAEAAQAFGLRRVPDAYVVLGNGQVNAFASGHGLRRFVVIYSDLFEIGGAARDPQALRFVISHEVGHLAAGHVSYIRLFFTQLALQIPLLGSALSRTQEYTADNHGYALAPRGVAGVMGLLACGKYLGAQVNLHALADRATNEKGFWLHLSVWMSSHPVATWRAHALRDRRRPGRVMFRPAQSTAWFSPIQPAGSLRSQTWPTPAQVLAALDSTVPQGSREEQFGRYPGVTYALPHDALQLADPTPQRVKP